VSWTCDHAATTRLAATRPARARSWRCCAPTQTHWRLAAGSLRCSPRLHRHGHKHMHQVEHSSACPGVSHTVLVVGTPAPVRSSTGPGARPPGATGITAHAPARVALACCQLLKPRSTLTVAAAPGCMVSKGRATLSRAGERAGGSPDQWQEYASLHGSATQARDDTGYECGEAGRKQQCAAASSLSSGPTCELRPS